MEVKVHPLSGNPTMAWDVISQSQKYLKINVSAPAPLIPENKARIVCMSDTHSLTNNIKFDIPFGDIFIHAGDFTRCGQLEEVKEFNEWIKKLPHKYKIAIAGNHELSFDRNFTHPFKKLHSVLDGIPTLGMAREHLCEAISNINIKGELTNCIYLQDSSVEIYGIKIYGSPWQPEFCKWAFNLPRGQACLDKWNEIPLDTDILITHTPPVGHGDLCCGGVRAGCVELLSVLQQRLHVKYHVFGHVHEGYGITSDGKIIFANASTCDLNYMPHNPPIVFDITMPPGFTKD